MNTPIHDIQGFLSLLGLPTLPGKENQYLNPDNFNTPHRMVEFNLYWEWKAIEGYTKDIDKATKLGDMKSAELFSHIRGEEEEHFDELLKRYNELTNLTPGKKKPGPPGSGLYVVGGQVYDSATNMPVGPNNVWPGNTGRSY
jgi:hypothetical protein